jgi:hypothetical protein
MGRNGGAQEMWHLIRNTVSVICIEADPVQESMWNSMLATITTRRTAIILLFVQKLLLPWPFLNPQSTTATVALPLTISFLGLCLSHISRPQFL